MCADKFSVRVNRDEKAEVWRKVWNKVFDCVYIPNGIWGYRSVNAVYVKGSVQREYMHSYKLTVRRNWITT